MVKFVNMANNLLLQFNFWLNILREVFSKYLQNLQTRFFLTPRLILGYAESCTHTYTRHLYLLTNRSYQEIITFQRCNRYRLTRLLCVVFAIVVLRDFRELGFFVRDP